MASSQPQTPKSAPSERKSIKSSRGEAPTDRKMASSRRREATFSATRLYTRNIPTNSEAKLSTDRFSW